MNLAVFKDKQKDLFFLCGLLIFAGLNIFSAITMDLHFDESYYWVWSQSMSFGYFDHPPLVAWLIGAGQCLFYGEAGVRAITIVLSTLSMIILWKMVKQYSQNAWLFWALIYSIILIHPYTFIATPDAPLFFSTAMFFFFLKRYIERNDFPNTLLLAFFIALMIYAKYHAFLVLLLALISNLKLTKRISFWLLCLLVLFYLTPHINWQIENHFPTFRYHLVDSHGTAYNPKESINYILSELAVTGPLLGWLYLYILFAIKANNAWEKSMKFVGAGFFVFFFITTFSGDFEAHWTLAAVVPMVILSYRYMVENPQWQKWVKIAGLVNFLLLLTTRIILITPLAQNIHVLNQFTGNRANAKIIEKYAKGNPVVFQDDWIDASRHSFYSSENKTGCINSAFSRHNQYDILESDESYQNENVLVLTKDSLQFANADTIQTSLGKFYGKTINDFRCYYNIQLKLNELSVAENTIDATVAIRNPYTETIPLGKQGTEAAFELWTRKKNKWVKLSEQTIHQLSLTADRTSTCHVHFDFSPSNYKKDKIYLTLKIGELKSIPSKCHVKL